MSFLQRLKQVFVMGDVPSPRDIVPVGAIKLLGDKVVVSGLHNLWIAALADTDSIDGIADIGHNVILTKNFYPKDLAVGDLIAWARYPGKTPLLHPIDRVGADNKGWYCRTMHFNRSLITRIARVLIPSWGWDRYIVRPEMIKGVAVIIVY